jgi:hypothetical protein
MAFHLVPLGRPLETFPVLNMVFLRSCIELDMEFLSALHVMPCAVLVLQWVSLMPCQDLMGRLFIQYLHPFCSQVISHGASAEAASSSVCRVGIWVFFLGRLRSSGQRVAKRPVDKAGDPAVHHGFPEPRFTSRC